MADFLSNNPEVLLQMMEDMDSDFSDDEFDVFIDDNDKQDDNCFFDKRETNTATTIVSSPGTTTSPTIPTNSSDTTVPTVTANSIPQFQERS